MDVDMSSYTYAISSAVTVPWIGDLLMVMLFFFIIIIVITIMLYARYFGGYSRALRKIPIIAFTPCIKYLCTRRMGDWAIWWGKNVFSVSKGIPV